MKTEANRNFVVSVWKLQLTKKRKVVKRGTGFGFPFKGTVDELYNLFDMYQKGHPDILVEASTVIP